MLRRAVALGGALLIVILIVLGVKGCLNARKHKELSDYADNVTQIVAETRQTSKRFFDKLDDPGKLSVTEFGTEVNADRSAVDGLATRVDDLDAPGDMSHAQGALELVYELRAAAMNEIANRMSTALGEIGAERAKRKIAAQMQKLLASDVLYAAVVRPEINGVLADNGIDDDDVPRSIFLPDTRWLDATEVESALGSVSGAATAATPGIHGLGLVGTSVNDTDLTPDVSTTVPSSGTPQVKVEAQNQGDSTENGVTVAVSVNGGRTLTDEIPSIAAGASASVTIPLTPAPTGQVTLKVKVEPVPGEHVTSNNEATYTVVFG